MEQYTEKIGWEEYIYLDFTKKLVSPFPVLVDIGANVGQFTHAFNQVHEKFTGFCFEPIPETYEHLKANVPACVKCFNTGLSDVNGQREIYYVPDKTSCTSLYKRPVYQKTAIKQTVEFTTLDLISHKFPPIIDYMKIDTEGHEYNILQGGVNLFYTRRIKIIHFEYGDCWPTAGNTLKAMLTMLLPLYKVYNRDMISITLDNYRENYDLQNFLAVMK